jgi:hypothetical protein
MRQERVEPFAEDDLDGFLEVAVVLAEGEVALEGGGEGEGDALTDRAGGEGYHISSGKK